jgi:GT2 family glycosyltransferase
VVDLSIVIPTYRRPDALPRTLDALERQTVSAGRFEAIVVDDPWDDDPAEVTRSIRAEDRPFAARQFSRERAGASSARNVGVRAAEGPIVLFLGDDILLRPDGLEQHLGCHEREPDERVGVLGPVVWSSEIRVSPFMRWLEEGIQFDYRSLPGDEATWAHLYTSNVSIKRSMLERVGGFDEERFPFGYEDLDVGYRMAEHGFRMIFNREAVGEHLHVTKLEDWRRRMANTAKAERVWVGMHPDLPAYFHDRFKAAVEGPPGSRLAAAAIGFVPRRLPLVGERLWTSADRWFCRRLGPAFLEAWEES